MRFRNSEGKDWFKELIGNGFRSFFYRWGKVIVVGGIIKLESSGEDVEG